jgi:hypothetical protein
MPERTPAAAMLERVRSYHALQAANDRGDAPAAATRSWRRQSLNRPLHRALMERPNASDQAMNTPTLPRNAACAHLSPARRAASDAAAIGLSPNGEVHASGATLPPSSHDRRLRKIIAEQEINLDAELSGKTKH